MRASLRAALAVSGLSLAVGCGAASTPERTTPPDNTNTDNTAHSDGPLTEDGRCTGSWETYSEACCARESDATWSAEQGCVPAVMVGPFVPPAMRAWVASHSPRREARYASWMNRPALRAALVVSGLTLGCGGAPMEEPTTTASEPSTATEPTASEPTATATEPTANVSTTNETCDDSLEDMSESCCNQSPGRVWEASAARCLFTAVPGPFVPPSMAG